jgi:hypothetical protein
MSPPLCVDINSWHVKAQCAIHTKARLSGIEALCAEERPEMRKGRRFRAVDVTLSVLIDRSGSE